MGIVNLYSTGKSWEKMLQRFGFLTHPSLLYFAWSRNLYNSENMGKLNSRSKGNVWENKQFKFMSFLNILDEAEIDTICKSWEKWIPIIRKKYTKKQTFQRYKFLKYLDKAEIHTITKIWEKWTPIVRKKYGKTRTFQS